MDKTCCDACEADIHHGCTCMTLGTEDFCECPKCMDIISKATS